MNFGKVFKCTHKAVVLCITGQHQGIAQHTAHSAVGRQWLEPTQHDDSMETNKVKKQHMYMKANLVVHPDKVISLHDTALDVHVCNTGSPV